MLDILKILFCIPFLIYSCYSDIKTRRVTDHVWLMMLAGGVFFILYDISIYSLPFLFSLSISAGILFVFLYIYSYLSSFFNIRQMGGADAKLLIVLSILFPIYPTFQAFNHVFPLNAPLNLFVFSVLGNAVTIAIIIPIGFAIYNFSKMGFHIDNPAYALLGYKTKISELDSKPIWIIQDFEEVNGKIESRYKSGGIEVNKESIDKFKYLLKKGLIKDEIWVTPKLPFMIPLTLGFSVAILYGDLLFGLVKFLVIRG